MKTINLLKKLINLLFWGMIVFSIVIFVMILILFISPESLPLMFQGYKMLFDADYFSWQIWIIPLANIFAFSFFILAIYYLKKCISPFQEGQFYSEEVIKNLKKSGHLFIIVALSTGFIRFIMAFVFNTFVDISLVNGSFGNASKTTALLSAIKNINFFLLIIGLFLLVFSSAFENGKLLKEENDLTI